jgi:glucose/arabinose dehydrogenase
MLTTADLSCFLVTFTASGSAVLLSHAFLGNRRRRWALIGISVVALGLGVGIASLSTPGENSVLQIGVRLFAGDRTHLILIAAGTFNGLLCGFGVASGRGRLRRAAGIVLYLFAVACFGLLTAKNRISPYLATPLATGETGSFIQESVASGFRIEEVAKLALAPTSIAVAPDGKVYVAGYGGLAFQNGSIVRIDHSDEAGQVDVKTVATHLNRPHGIAFHNASLYVSRAGQYAKAVNGRIVQQDTGAVTKLDDLDGDGVYDHYTDVVSGLPGAQLPDGLHQNNGIAFDKNGKLYVTVGAPTDHGPVSQPYAGTIVTSNADGTAPSVFARGLRNPFDLAFGPDGELFCTDNDSNDANEGDEVNHVVEGRHYGFPYTSRPGIAVSGSQEPLLRCSSAQGLAYAPTGSMPAGFDNCLYVAAYGEGHIRRIVLERSKETFRARSEFFARVPSVIDIAVGPNGVLYACSHDERKVYRIMPK